MDGFNMAIISGEAHDVDVRVLLAAPYLKRCPLR